MDTISILMAQYGGKVVVPLDVVCRDYFSPLTVPTLVRKISAGEIALPLIRIEHSRRSAKGVRIQDLAHYIDTRPTVTAKRVDVDPTVASSDNAPPSKSADTRSVVEPCMEKTLTLKMAADLLAVSYSTVYAHKEEMGFFQIGNQWRVWPETLRARLAAKQEEKANQRSRAAIPACKGAPRSPELTAHAVKARAELDRLLAKPSLRSRRKANAG